MKITIWHQLSSNHSASYTIVGEFATPERAREVRETIAGILMEIMLGYAEDEKPVFDRMPTEIEIEIGQRYGFEWQEAVDWLYHDYLERKDPRKFVVNHGNYVVVEPDSLSTRQTGHQFTHLLQALGAETKAAIQMGHEPVDYALTFANLDYQVICIAPSEEVAGKIATIFNQISKEYPYKDPNFPRGLMLYHPRFDELTKGMAKEDFLREESLFFEGAKAAEEIDEDKLSALVPQDRDIAWMLHNVYRDLNFKVSDVVREGRKIEVQFKYIDKLWLLMPALSGWLEDQGCEVDWEVTQRNP